VEDSRRIANDLRKCSSFFCSVFQGAEEGVLQLEGGISDGRRVGSLEAALSTGPATAEVGMGVVVSREKLIHQIAQVFGGGNFLFDFSSKGLLVKRHSMLRGCVFLELIEPKIS